MNALGKVHLENRYDAVPAERHRILRKGQPDGPEKFVVDGNRQADVRGVQGMQLGEVWRLHKPREFTKSVLERRLDIEDG